MEYVYNRNTKNKLGSNVDKHFDKRSWSKFKHFVKVLFLQLVDLHL